MAKNHIQELKAKIATKEAELKRLRDHAKELKGTKRRFAIESTNRDIKGTKEVISFLKKVLSEAKKKPVNKVLRLTAMSMPIRKGEYPDCDFGYYRLRFSMIDKQGYKNVIDVSPWHVITVVGGKIANERTSTIAFDADHYTENGCYDYFPRGKQPKIKATKAELLKWVNRESRDNYTSVVISKS